MTVSFSGYTQGATPPTLERITYSDKKYAPNYFGQQGEEVAVHPVLFALGESAK
jgi:hypothetical protein